MKYLLTIFFAFIFLSCQKESSFIDLPLVSPDGEAPVIGGIQQTFENGQPGQKFGNPSERNQLYDNISELGDNRPWVFPNPVYNRGSIGFQLNKTTFVRIYVVPAKASNSFKQIISCNSSFNLHDGFAIDTIVNTKLTKGAHFYFLDIFDKNQTRSFHYPEGLYRVYLRTESNLYWNDILVDIDGF